MKKFLSLAISPKKCLYICLKQKDLSLDFSSQEFGVPQAGTVIIIIVFQAGYSYSFI